MARPASSRFLLATLATTVALPLTPASSADGELRIPAPRVGDGWTIAIGEDPYGFEATELGTAVDRRGRERDALIVDVEGFHPIAFESKQMTRHTMAIDAASGVAIADIAAWEFGGDSDPAAYSSFEPNNPDGWPGWVYGGGLLAGQTLVPGTTVEVPLVMTSTRGAESIRLGIEPAASSELGRCVRASGSIHYPTWITWYDDGYVRRTLDLDVTTVVCEGAPYAQSVQLAFRSGDNAWSARSELRSFTPGSGAAIEAGPYQEPGRQILGGFAPFDGSMKDGGALPVWSLEAAQTAAANAPGLLAWRVANPDGYLVAAKYRRPEDEVGATAGVGAAEWELTYAAPSGAQHRVLAHRRLDVVSAVDLPAPGSYGFPVPALSSWSGEVLTPAGVITNWRKHAGATALPTALRWEPLANGDRWFVLGTVRASCDGDVCQGSVGMEMPFRSDTGAPETGEHPLPA